MSPQRGAYMDIGIVKTAIDSGLSIGIFALCVWLVTTIVNRLCGTMDKLNNKMDTFMDRVRAEHTQGCDNQKALMEQHKEMITTLGRINGYKS